MRSNNPVFTRVEGFNGVDAASGQAIYAGNGQTYAGYGTTPTDAPSRMSIDSVVNRTGLALGALLIAAAAAWFFTGDPDPYSAGGATAVQSLYVLTLVGGLGGFVLSLVNSFKKVISPMLVIAYAALEGLFVGAVSKVFQYSFGEGVVTGAVLGTIAAFAGTLAAYKFFNIKVTNKFRTWVIGAMFGFVALSLVDLGLSFFGSGFGWNGLGTMGMVSAVIGLGIAVLMLILDFDYVERGIAAGLPERESWRAAFGLTVTLVWIYVQLLRLLAMFSRR